MAVKAQPFFLVKYQQGFSSLHTHMCRTEPHTSEKWDMYLSKIMNNFLTEPFSDESNLQYSFSLGCLST